MRVCVYEYIHVFLCVSEFEFVYICMYLCMYEYMHDNACFYIGKTL